MASTSSREAALERRKALTTGGKKAAGRFSSSPGRVRTAADAPPSRSESPAPAAVSAPAAGSTSNSTASSQVRSRPARSLAAPASSVSPQRSKARPIANPSRELVLARREALSKAGKRADRSKDRTRTDLPPQRAAAAAASPASSSPAASGDKPCTCKGQRGAAASSAASATPAALLSLSAPSSNGRSSNPKRAAQYNPSRALVLARRDSLSKRGKSASTPTSTAAASVARQGNPDLSSRELSQKVRELKSKVGSAGSCRNGGTRPCGPNLHGSKQGVSSDASLKVGVSETSRGQVVTGTQANRSSKTTGNEAATCRAITGTEYLGAEVFQTFCKSEAPSRQPAKVRVTATSHGNSVTGNEVGRSEKVTGDEPGTCKTVTGTEYISANQAVAYCGSATPSPRKVGRSQTVAGQPVSGVMVGRSEKVTGDEPGSGRQLTGDQYLAPGSDLPGRAPAKVSRFETLRGTGITGTSVGRSEHVTGDEPGSCRIVTGDEYVGNQQYERFCGTRPEPEAAKVGFSVTNRAQVVSGTRTGRSEKVTGDEPGTCKTVTGTPYAGLEQAGDWCSTSQVNAIRQRTPIRGGSVMSGIQPGIGGVMTGASRGACESISGTPYVGADQMLGACGAAGSSGAASSSDADFPQPLAGGEPWQQFSIQSPARAAQIARDRSGAVTGSSYETGGRITGPFDMAGGKVTGTEQFRFDRPSAQLSRGPIQPAGPGASASTNSNPSAPAAAEVESAPVSRVTGEGNSAGLRITGDDWDRGKHVTGTEGASARRRNPSRVGAMGAAANMLPKRNDDVAQPVSRVTGSSGNTDKGSLITVSGGARG